MVPCELHEDAAANACAFEYRPPAFSVTHCAATSWSGVLLEVLPGARGRVTGFLEPACFSASSMTTNSLQGLTAPLGCRSTTP